MANFELLDNIKVFFDTYFNVVESKYKNDLGLEIKHELNFLARLFGDLDQIQIKNMNFSNF